ncbi:MAG: hypothetical protein R2816_01165 [Flavobacteriaceae bacterium]|nr:hypothetical protein [Flavobacteriaceae bacterium]
MTQQLNEILELKRYDDFFSSLPKIISELNEKERQELLVDIIDFHYDRKFQSDFKKAFDLIIGSKLNLNFNIEHWAPTFLSLVILRTPSIELFEYFVSKGADINFIGDTLAFEEEENLKYEKKHLLFGQYQTCLDFAQIKLDDLLTVDYNYDVPDKKIDNDWREVLDEDGEVKLGIREYLYLHEQSEYLYDLVKTDKLKDHIIYIGGKTYDELNNKKDTTANNAYK